MAGRWMIQTRDGVRLAKSGPAEREKPFITGGIWFHPCCEGERASVGQVRPYSATVYQLSQWHRVPVNPERHLLRGLRPHALQEGMSVGSFADWHCCGRRVHVSAAGFLGQLQGGRQQVLEWDDTGVIRAAWNGAESHKENCGKMYRTSCIGTVTGLQGVPVSAGYQSGRVRRGRSHTGSGGKDSKGVAQV
jgi:hypothetical protein